MSQQNPLELAKQGNPSAIAALINRNLTPKGVTAKVSRNGRCLRVVLESNKVLNQESLIEFIHRGISKLEIDEIDILQILGKQVDNKTPTWTQAVNLKPSYSEHIAPQRPKSESNRKIISKGKVIQPKKAAKSHWKLIALSIFTIGFVGWLLSTEEYQMTMQEMPFGRAFWQLMSSLFNSSPNKSSSSSTASNERVITASEFGDEWPLSVQNGRLRCLPPGAVFFEADSGETYAVNGTAIAMAQSQNKNLPDIEDIWLYEPNPELADLGIRKTMVLIQEGQKLCN